jgi:hypothetical protein
MPNLSMRIVLGAIVAFFTAGHCPAALVIQGYDAIFHDRFANNSNFIGSGFDWTAVGRTASTWGTLISPSFALTVTHGAASGPIRFYQSNDPNGAFIQRTIVENIILTQSGVDRSSDLTLSRLSAPITGVNYAPILDISPTEIQGSTQFVFGLSNTLDPFTNMRLGRNHIDLAELAFSHPNLNNGNSKNDVTLWDYDNPGGVGRDEAWVQGGDSGAPSFVVINGIPTLVGVHWFQFGAGSFGFPNPGSGDTLVSSFIDEINSAIAATGSSERVLTIVAVPEPSAGLLILSFASVWGFRRRKRSF